MADARLTEPDPTAGAMGKVMVVDDDVVTRTVISEVLKHYGYKVVEAVGGEEAIAEYAESKDEIDLVILDISMPGKDGAETYRAMKQLCGGLKALFVSGYTAHVMNEKGLDGEDVSLLSKPIVPKEFATKVREVLAR